MFTLTCLSYKDKDSIPPKYTHHSIKGQNISPGFRWEDPPTTAKSFAFTIIDPHPVAKNWVHWFVIDIPFNAREIPEGASGTSRMPKGARELMNTYGEQGYGGPAPPKGSDHRYYFKLYALNTELPLDARATAADLEKAMKGHTVAEAQLMGRYRR